MFFLFLAAEDDPDDADFEPDYGVSSSRTANKVQILSIIFEALGCNFLMVARSTRFK